MKKIQITKDGVLRDAEVGDFVGMQEILSGAGISTQGLGEVIEVCKTEDGDNAYLVKHSDGKYRMLIHQDRWGYAYDYHTEYKIR